MRLTVLKGVEMPILFCTLVHCRAFFTSDETGMLDPELAAVCDSHNAATPATCGVAIDVPDIEEYLSRAPLHAPDAHTLVIDEPGARMSTQLP